MTPSIVNTGVDRYVIDAYLAEGGMGAIFLGKKVGMEGFEKRVVLKQLLPEFTAQREFIDLFLREARLSASLDHANIVHTYDLVAAGEDLFIVMEYVRGGDLRTILRRVKLRGRRLEPAAALFITRELLSALAYAHGKKRPDGHPLGLIHRDISPANIMISAAGEVKLTDFGIAKATTHKSVFYRVKGKVGYMSPEQARADGPLDQRSDLYSLAVCLYEMLSGERLFVADLLSTPAQIYAQPVPTLEGRPGMPRGLDRVLGRALAEDPGHRYQTALDLQDALVQLAYDAEMLYSARELAAHLGQVCGEDPTTWGDDEAAAVLEPAGEGPGTPLLEEQPRPPSGVELTSVFTAEGPSNHLPPFASGVATDAPGPALPQPGGPPPPAEAAGTEPTRALRVPARARRRRPTRPVGPLTGPPASRRASVPPADEPVEELMELAPVGEAEEQTHARDPARAHPRPTAEVTPLAPAPAAAPPRATAEVTPLTTDPPRRWFRVAAGLGVLVLAGSIAALVGLSGPDLGEGEATPVDQGFLARGAGSDAGEPDPGSGATTQPLVESPPDARPPRIPDLLQPDLTSGAPEDPTTAASLKVRSYPEGATVAVDGVPQCEAPCTVAELDPQQVYRLTLRLAGYQSWSALVDLHRQRQLAISAYLARPPAGPLGYLQVAISPPAELYIDGKQSGWISSEGRLPLPPGQYEVSLTHPRQQSRPGRLVTIRPHRTVTWRARY